MSEPLFSFVCTAWASRRPLALPVLLASLRAQSCPDWECLVLDSDFSISHSLLCLTDHRFYYHPQPLGHPHSREEMYHATEWGIRRSMAPWLHFSNDDGYLVPWFAERMLRMASLHSYDIVLCDTILGSPKVHGLLTVQPFCGMVDKTSMIVRREVALACSFSGKDDPDSWQLADGKFVEEVVRRGAKVGIVREPLVVHN